MAVPKFVLSTQALITNKYTNIKIELLDGKHKIYFKENVFRKT